MKFSKISGIVVHRSKHPLLQLEIEEPLSICTCVPEILVRRSVNGMDLPDWESAAPLPHAICGTCPNLILSLYAYHGDTFLFLGSWDYPLEFDQIRLHFSELICGGGRD